MMELVKERRYDKAIQVVQNWMNDSRRDHSNDGFLYQQIAMVYIEKAYREPATRADSLHAAEGNLEKALAFFDSKAPEDNDVELFGIGGAYQLLGDVANEGKCQYYGKARLLFARQLPLIKGDSYTAYGRTIPLETVRADIKKHLDALSEKCSQAGCQVR
jgi:predicted metal-dependent hydrolase